MNNNKNFIIISSKKQFQELEIEPCKQILIICIRYKINTTLHIGPEEMLGFEVNSDSILCATCVLVSLILN